MPTVEGVVWVMGGLQRESAAGDVAGEGAVGVGMDAVGSVSGVASGGTGVSIEDIMIVKLYSILQTDMMHRAMKYLICTYLKSTLSSTYAYNYKTS